MLPALQPSRPKPSQQRPQPSYAYQQTRPIYYPPQPPLSEVKPQPQASLYTIRPRSQVEAMPPFGPGAPFLPQRNLYDSAIRHPVFFTEQLRKPPFPMPEMASQGWSPVASGYIFEQRKANADGIPKTKL